MSEALALIPANQIRPSTDNPRQTFAEPELQELASSIQREGIGILQPILVRRAEGGYELIVGERRWRACVAAGVREIPCLIKEATDVQVAEMQLVENIQRADLKPLEEAAAIKRLIDATAQTPEVIAKRIGKSAAWVRVRLSLLTLEDDFKEALERCEITINEAGVLARMSERERHQARLTASARGLSTQSAARIAVGAKRERKSPRSTQRVAKTALHATPQAYDPSIKYPVPIANGKNKRPLVVLPDIVNTPKHLPQANAELLDLVLRETPSTLTGNMMRKLVVPLFDSLTIGQRSAIMLRHGYTALDSMALVKLNAELKTMSLQDLNRLLIEIVTAKEWATDREHPSTLISLAKTLGVSREQSLKSG